MAATHHKTIGYILWVFGFTGAHRFYFGKPLTGTLWLLTVGLLGVGWFIDLFLIPGMERNAGQQYRSGRVDYTVGWILQTIGVPLGLHRFYLGKWATGVLWLLSGGLFGIGWAYDFWTLNEQIHEANH